MTRQEALAEKYVSRSELINKIYNDYEAQLKAKDEEIKRLNNLYADIIKDLGRGVMEIEKLKEQYNQCLDDYIKCAERNNQ